MKQEALVMMALFQKAYFEKQDTSEVLNLFTEEISWLGPKEDKIYRGLEAVKAMLWRKEYLWTDYDLEVGENEILAQFEQVVVVSGLVWLIPQKESAANRCVRIVLFVRIRPVD